MVLESNGKCIRWPDTRRPYSAQRNWNISFRLQDSVQVLLIVLLLEFLQNGGFQRSSLFVLETPRIKFIYFSCWISRGTKEQSWSYNESRVKRGQRKALKIIRLDPRICKRSWNLLRAWFAGVSAEEHTPFLDLVKKSEYFLEGSAYGFGLIEKKLSKSELDFADSFFTRDSAFNRGYEESTRAWPDY